MRYQLKKAALTLFSWQFMIFLVLAGCCFSSCYYDKADLVYPAAPACDTSAVTYSGKILPILTTKCYSCHSGAASSGGGVKLDSYAFLKVQVNNGQLIGCVEQRSGYSAMPQSGGKLPECEIATIRTWIRIGSPNN